MYFACSPINYKQLINYAYNIRKIFHVENEYEFPIVKIVELISSSFNDENEGFELEVVEDDDPVFSKENKEVAKYDYINNIMYVSLTTYNGACDGIGMHKFSLTHEFSHYVLFKLTGREPILTNVKPSAFKDPEWQANALSGLLLVPYELTYNMDDEEIVKKCNVSPECAAMQLYKRKKYPLISEVIRKQ